MNPVYLDCNATTPIDPEVREVLLHYLTNDFGNEGSRTHEFGARAKQAVQHARDQIATVVGAHRDEVIFTSGATESNNLAILGLRDVGKGTGRRHLITTSIEHKAVLEPFHALEQDGFDVTVLPVTSDGVVTAESVGEALRADTLLVSVMHVNNETGIRQPIQPIIRVLRDHSAYFHTDAAQGFGKDLDTLTDPRIDLISISGHKLYAPKGVGALVMRRRGYDRIPLRPLTYGGGQERGIRPGTLPVALVAALGKAAEIAMRDSGKRSQVCSKLRSDALDAFASLQPRLTGNQSLVMPHVLNLSFEGLDSEALMLALKDLVAISNGSACTSNSYTPSHVLKAMGMNDDDANACVRISWCHLTPSVNWQPIVDRINALL